MLVNIYYTVQEDKEVITLPDKKNPWEGINLSSILLELALKLPRSTYLLENITEIKIERLP